MSHAELILIMTALIGPLLLLERIFHDPNPGRTKRLHVLAEAVKAGSMYVCTKPECWPPSLRDEPVHHHSTQFGPLTRTGEITR